MALSPCCPRVVWQRHGKMKGAGRRKAAAQWGTLWWLRLPSLTNKMQGSEPLPADVEIVRQSSMLTGRSSFGGRIRLLFCEKLN